MKYPKIQEISSFITQSCMLTNVFKVYSQRKPYNFKLQLKKNTVVYQLILFCVDKSALKISTHFAPLGLKFVNCFRLECLMEQITGICLLSHRHGCLGNWKGAQRPRKFTRHSCPCHSECANEQVTSNFELQPVM